LKIKLALFFGIILIFSITIKLLWINSGSVSDIIDIKSINAYSQIDSLFYFNNDRYFGRVNHQNWTQDLNTLNSIDYKSESMKYYAFGHIYYNLWKEAIAARNLLLEIQNSLYCNPPIDRFYPQIPITEDVLIDDYNFQPNYTSLIKEQYSDLKDNFNLNTNRINKISNEEVFFFENENFANPRYFIGLANQYYKTSINQLTSFLNYDDSLFTIRSLKSRVRLAILYAINGDDNKVIEIISPTFYSAIVDSLYANTYNLKIEVIELLPHLEIIGYIGQDDITEIYNNLKYDSGKALLLYKRKILDLENIYDIPLVNEEILVNETEDSYSKDIIYYPEYIIALAEILSMSGNFSRSEEIINHFWFKESTPRPPPNCENWLFENYPEYLLNAIRLGYWDGARLPFYQTKLYDAYFENKDFTGIRKTFSLFVAIVTGHIGRGGLHND